MARILIKVVVIAVMAASAFVSSNPKPIKPSATYTPCGMHPISVKK